MAEAADCATLRVPGYERPLCPDATQKLLLGPDGLDHNPRSPIRGTWIPSLSAANYQALKQLCPKTVAVTVGTQVHYHVVASMCGRATSDFDRRVAKQQPLNVLASIGKDTLKLFAPGRVTSTGDPSLTRWQFQTYYPQYPPYIVISRGAFVFGTYNHEGVEQQIGTGAQFRGGNPSVVRPLASFLRGYQMHGGYTPGPLYAFAILAGLAGSLSRAAPPGHPGTARHGAGLPAVLRHRRLRAAVLRRVRVQLALPAARPGHPAARRGTGHHRPLPAPPAARGGTGPRHGARFRQPGAAGGQPAGRARGNLRGRRGWRPGKRPWPGAAADRDRPPAR